MKTIKKWILPVLLAILIIPADYYGWKYAVIDTVQAQNRVGGILDPCFTPSILKSSAVINVVTATTTSLVAVSGTKSVYVCSVSMTIAPSATTADTAQLEYGTGATCTSPTVLTGSFGAGDVTTTTGLLYVSLGSDGVEVTAPSGNGVCLVSAGTTVNIQGVIQYVQQ